MNNIIKLLFLLILLFTIGFSKTFAGDNKFTLFVSVLPQAYFVERIGGAHVDVKVLVGPGLSPATYSPSPKQMAALAKSKIYFTIGVPFEEKLLNKISSFGKSIKIVKTNKSQNHTANPHHDGSSHDPHVWLDPIRVIEQSEIICDELIKIDPKNSREYLNNLDDFKNDLLSLDRRLRESLMPFKGRKFLVFHPAYGHFAKAYGLIQYSVEKDGKEPGPKQIALWIDTAKREKITLIIVQSQFATSSAKIIAKAIGATVIPLDPLAKDYILNMEKIAGAISKSMKVIK